MSSRRFAPLRDLPQSFWLLTAARGIGTFASNMLAIVIGWSIFHETGSTLALGFAGLAEAIPAIGLALWAGYWVDRGDALQIYRRTQVAHLGLTTLALGCLQVRAALGPTGLLVGLLLASVIAGAARSFLQPCLYTLVPKVVSREQLPQAASVSSAVLQLARVLGPGLGGLLYAGVGASWALVCALLCFGGALVALARMAQLPPPPSQPLAGSHSKGPALGSKTAELFIGLRYVFAHPILLPALSLDMICVFFGGVTAVLPAFAEQILAAGPAALGCLRAAPALGAVIGSLLLTRLDIRPRAGVALLVSVTGYGLCTVLFALSRNIGVSLTLLLLSGLLDSVSVQVRQLVVQLMSPEAMRGRISAVNSMFIGSSNELGEFESGVMAWWWGLVPSVLYGSAVCLCCVAAMALGARRLRSLDLREVAPTAAECA